MFEEFLRKALALVGENPHRGGLIETPKRFEKAWKEWFSGYGVDVPSLFKTFEDGAENYDQMITVKQIPFYSHCEHHIAPITGHVTVSYIPNEKIVGLSKIARVVDAFARRLQVQERLTNQIAEAVFQNLECRGVGVYCEAEHFCMKSRGVRCDAKTVTTALLGIYSTDATCKSEFLNLCQK